MSIVPYLSSKIFWSIIPYLQDRLVERFPRIIAEKVWKQKLLVYFGNLRGLKGALRGDRILYEDQYKNINRKGLHNLVYLDVTPQFIEEHLPLKHRNAFSTLHDATKKGTPEVFGWVLEKARKEREIGQHDLLSYFSIAFFENNYPVARKILLDHPHLDNLWKWAKQFVGSQGMSLEDLLEE